MLSSPLLIARVNVPLLEFTFENIPFILINNHYICCGDGDLNLDDSGD